ncbi:coatomer subunit gamma-2 [Trichonephila inaurata madagascariensis]|uniref:Coatomer subunit gamma n=1 Tax=Trichonephila inaurata madagascariensis TaxID=2747483 RepID=A0A8X7CTC2_9ARAC|nr:coatomer subunit gamma-2 [Trichonephila inaurata madagascariensis]
MYALKREKKEEEDGGSGNPFHNLEKTTVLQEARTFNETPLNPRKCAHILTKVIYLLNQGEQLGTVEATEAFFAMTKLFQSNDPIIRRLVYLCIKELATIAEDVIIVTSSLTKDMTGKEEQYRPAAIRALCRITDGGMLQAIERYMKQAIVDKNSSVSSAALVSSLHLMKESPEVVKRWVNEAQEAANSDNVMVQYHAVGLLYQIRKNDKLAISKLLAKYSTKYAVLKSSYAVCLLIRIAAKLIEDDDAGPESPHFDFIETCLRHKSEMVIYEAAHAIVNMKSTTPRELAPAVSVLQLFCASSKPTLRFAAVKTLNKVAMTHPAAVTACNIDLENLITDSNRNIATLAITTLLKTGSESSVDRLMKQITSFMSEISDEFKVVVVQSIRSLCQKFPRKHNVMMNFLSSILRDEGGFEYKKAIVDTIIHVIEDSPDGKEAGLAHLCEFIEDCEHTSLGVKVLYLLGKEGPKTSQPCKYIRYIYNRLILENAPVRAAAVSSLAKFGAHCEDLLPNVTVLLQRSLLDTDDEVRDRATYYLNILNEKQKAVYSQYILNGLQVSIVGLEKALHQYTLEPSEAPFDIKSVPLATQPLAEEKKAELFTSVYVPIIGKTKEKVAASRQDIFAEQLAAVPELAALNLGPLFKSSLPIELTESETEFVVRCIKHTFSNHIVLQFDCTNTLSDQILENVYVQVEPSDGFEVVAYAPCAKLQYSVPGTTYACVSLPSDPLVVIGTFGNTLKYLVKDCDPNSGEPDDDEGYEDEYVLEDLDILLNDHIQKVLKTNFGAAWEEVTAKNELEDTYAFNLKTLEDAVKNITHFLGMQPCERSDKVPENKSSHVLFLSGVYRGGHAVLVRAKLALRADTEGVTMNIAVRSTDPNVSEIVASAIG